MQSVEVARLTPGQQKVHDSMVELLGRAGLGYRGDYVDVLDYRVHYLDYGSGAPVILVHGGGSGSAIWFRQIAALSKHFRVIAPDNPIFGLSTQLTYPAPINKLTTEYLEAFLDALGLQKATFVGHSLGGFGVARFAMQHPDRVEKLVLLDSAGMGRHLPWGFRLISLPVVGRMFGRPNRWMHEKFFATNEVVKQYAPGNDAYLEYAFNVVLNEGHSEAIRLNLPMYAGLRGQTNLFSDSELRAIKNDTLVIWGRDERFFPVSHGQRAASLIPNARLEVLDDCGHVAQLDQPERINELLLEFVT